MSTTNPDGSSDGENPEASATPPYAPPAYGAPSGADDSPGWAAPPAENAPPAYGAAPAYSAPPAYDAAPPYGAPPAYGAAPPYGAPPVYGTAAAYAGGYPAAPKTNLLAIVSLIAGLVGVFVIPFIASIAAVITGHIALKQLKTSGEQGRGMALAGTIIGWVSVGIGLLVLVVLVIIFGIGISSYRSV